MAQVPGNFAEREVREAVWSNVKGGEHDRVRYAGQALGFWIMSWLHIHLDNNDFLGVVRGLCVSAGCLNEQFQEELKHGGQKPPAMHSLEDSPVHKILLALMERRDLR